jgi:hypothetical protein
MLLIDQLPIQVIWVQNFYAPSRPADNPSDFGIFLQFAKKLYPTCIVVVARLQSVRVWVWILSGPILFLCVLEQVT